MGKNKGNKSKGKKEQNIFKVAGVRKSKTKTVKTNLKKLNVHTKNKTDEANKKFSVLQDCVMETTVDSTKDKKSKQIARVVHKPNPDVNITAEEFSKL